MAEAQVFNIGAQLPAAQAAIHHAEADHPVVNHNVAAANGQRERLHVGLASEACAVSVGGVAQIQFAAEVKAIEEVKVLHIGINGPCCDLSIDEGEIGEGYIEIGKLDAACFKIKVVDLGGQPEGG